MVDNTPGQQEFKNRPESEQAGSVRAALMGDVPAVLDSIWRRVEFYMYRPGEFVFDAAKAAGAAWEYRRFDPGNSVLLALYALLTVFIVVGPTIDTFCGLGGLMGLMAIKVVTSLLAVWVAVQIFSRFNQAMGGRLKWRLGLRQSFVAMTHQHAATSAVDAAATMSLRQKIAAFMLDVIEAFTIAPLVILVWGLWRTSDVTEQCVGATGWVWPAVLQLALIVAIPLCAWWVLRHYRGYPPAVVSDTTPALTEHASRNTFLALAGLWVAGIVPMLPFALHTNAKEAVSGPYLQTFWIVMAVLMLIALLARPFAARRIASLASSSFKDFSARLKTAELLNVLEDSDPPPKGRLLAAFVTGIGMRPMQVLLLPAFFAITVPRNWLWSVYVALVFACLVSTYGTLRTRWRQVVSGIERWFFVGLQLPVSLLVIVLGILRLLGEQYVSTVLEAAPIGTLFTGIAISYLATWFYEVWINRWLAEPILRRLGASESEVARGYYPLTIPPRKNDAWTVSQHALLYIHGPGRIGVQGWQECSDANGKLLREERFANYTFVELFSALATDTTDDKLFMEDLQRQLRVYFYTLNGLVALAAAGLFWAHSWASAPEQAQPVIEAAAPATAGVDLVAKLTSPSAEPALIVAASGGGTRAALYTAHALQGLQTLGQAHNIVLISGASGGGAAAAAFVDRFNQLTKVMPTIGDASQQQQTLWESASQWWTNLWTHSGAIKAIDDPWADYRNDVTAPFIADVLDGMNELRIADHVAMGQLLVESMNRRLYKTLPDKTQPTFGSLSSAADARPALILNSTVSGHPASYSTLLRGRAAWDDGGDGCASVKQPFGWLAGDRVVYTNLGRQSFMQPSNPQLPDVRFRFTVINDPQVQLAQAAALNANFPPVFPNARITVARTAEDLARDTSPCKPLTASYFVTDGGATENLSLVSALVALSNALQSMNDTQWAALRPLHIVAIEASAVDYAYSQDRGVGAATGGAKERLAGGMTQLLLKDIEQQLKLHGKAVAANGAPNLTVHFLPLPLAFRSRGGFGTHWMYADTIKVSNPLPMEIPKWYQFWRSCGAGGCNVTLHKDDIAMLWSGLFERTGGFCQAALTVGDKLAKPDALTVQQWVCGGKLSKQTTAESLQHADYQVEAWQSLVQELDVKH